MDAVKHERWSRPMSVGDIVPAIVVSGGGEPGAPRAVAQGALLVKAGKYFVEIPKAGYAWTRKTAPDFVKPGDIVSVRLDTIDEPTQFATGSLEQDPVIEGALVAIDNQTGQVRAMIGGFDFARSKFNRARQAMRQMGSTFKPIVYTAAIDRGYTPVSIIDDAPAQLPEKLWLELKGNDEPHPVASFKSYRSARAAYLAAVAAWQALPEPLPDAG